MNKKNIFLLGIAGLIIITQFSSNTQQSALSFSEIPADFQYDGCSMFPDGDYRDCCTTHDDAYFFGGDWTGRLSADNALFQCVKEKSHWYSSPLAGVMWVGVRFGGAPLFPTSYRWGFGRDLY